MTKQEIHRRALLAAAKIALVTVGCSDPEGGIAPLGVSAPTAMPTASTSASPMATVMPTTTATVMPTTTATATATTAPTGSSLPGGTCGLSVYAKLTEESELCCEDKIKGTPVSPETGEFETGTMTPGLASCCKAVIGYLDTHPPTAASAHDLSWEQKSACCRLSDPLPLGPTCTPWGPPPPPAMPVGWV